MVNEIFVEISVIIVLATLFAGLMKLLKQPLIIGYIITGLLLSFYSLDFIRSTETIRIFSQMGVAFLLFIVGLNLRPHVIKEVGMISLITGLGQVVFTSIIGFVIARLLGFDMITSIYVAVSLTFSSTIIIMKLLSDRKDLDKLYGKISIGFLLVQDIIAIFALIIISSLSSGNLQNLVLELVLKLVILLSLLVIISKLILPKLSDFFAKSQEMLFIFAIAWGLGLATLFFFLGFSFEIGALIAGVVLSLSPYHLEISSRMKPLRDFFIILFFILIGANTTFVDITNLIWPAIVFSLFILIGNPLIIMVLMGLMGYSKRNGFMAGLTVAQISEFSLILIALGISIGHISNEILSMVTIIGVITISGSTYFIMYADKIYKLISGYLDVFERNSIKKEKKRSSKYDIILFGHNRVGYDFLKSFKKLKKKFLVVDYDPKTIAYLNKNKIKCKYGDADDEEFLEGLNLDSLRMAVSTIPDFETNWLLINKIRGVNKKAIIIIIAHTIDDAYGLYDAGATYVIMPHFLGGSYASMLIEKYGLNLGKFLKEKRNHIYHLKKRKLMGHEHPLIEKG